MNATLNRRTETPLVLHACTAEDLMTSPAVTIGADATLAVAAAEFARTGVRRLFVLRHGEVVGVLSRRDLVRVFTRGDADLEREVPIDPSLLAATAKSPNGPPVTVTCSPGV